MSENKNRKLDWKSLEIGGLWLRDGPETAYSGKFKIKNKEFKALVLPNRFPTDNGPKFRVYLTPDSYKDIFGKEAPEFQNTRPTENKPVSKPIKQETKAEPKPEQDFF